ncbi:MAG: hypothetical protein H6728_10800 [Myxococcales bacterium]|nr:hypothetical protein [Myxococcales bacterium]MCB9643548.1 hypothetical protein [Myxococcales bacterium]
MKQFESINTNAAQAAVLPLEGIQAYLQALVDEGALEGRIGHQALIEELEPAIEIIHKVLAGAELSVRIDVIREPDAAILAELEQKRREAEKAANQQNAMFGMSYVTV